MRRILLIGCGYWGNKLRERLEKLVGCENIWIADPDGHQIPLEPYRNRAVVDYTKVLDKVDSCVVATPIHTHFEIARTCLEAGKNVLVEKPMAKKASEARDLEEIASRKRLKLFTDLTFLQDPRLSRVTIPERFVWSGPPSGRSQESILWTWGPHPISIMLHKQGKPISVEGVVEDNYCNVTYHYGMRFIQEGIKVELSWRGNPELAVVRTVYGSTKARFLYPHDPHVISLGLPMPNPDPLTRVCEAFVKLSGQKSRINSIGRETVEVLEWTEETLKKHG